MSDLDLQVRNATATDLDRIAELETNIFAAHSITPFAREHFFAWLEVYPRGFFVAEQGGEVVGYTYTQVINCDYSDPYELDRWVSFDAVNDRGYTRASHRCDGGYHLGVNIGSIVPGAGKLLVEALVRLGENTQKPLLGMSRISGLKSYADQLTRAGIVDAAVSHAAKHAIALFYVLECAKLVHGSVRLMPKCAGLNCSGLPTLPVPSAPDPVLCKYLRNKYFAIWALLPEFIKDPASLNYAVLIGPAK
ncbi:MAG: hypothetical protein HYT15_01330 [Candidatus Magasanikbacteria bacterium]|nr:hypothetical protein [Candidatus Magasanikbacteria bacterium]